MCLSTPHLRRRNALGVWESAVTWAGLVDRDQPEVFSNHEITDLRDHEIVDLGEDSPCPRVFPYREFTDLGDDSFDKTWQAGQQC